MRASIFTVLFTSLVLVGCSVTQSPQMLVGNCPNYETVRAEARVLHDRSRFEERVIGQCGPVYSRYGYVHQSGPSNSFRYQSDFRQPQGRVTRDARLSQEGMSLRQNTRHGGYVGPLKFRLTTGVRFQNK